MGKPRHRFSYGRYGIELALYYTCPLGKLCRCERKACHRARVATAASSWTLAGARNAPTSCWRKGWGVRELIFPTHGTGITWSCHQDINGSRHPCRRSCGDLRSAIHGEAGGERSTKGHGCGAGQAPTCDGHGRAACGWANGWRKGRDTGRAVKCNLISFIRGAGAPRGFDQHIYRSRRH